MQSREAKALLFTVGLGFAANGCGCTSTKTGSSDASGSPATSLAGACDAGNCTEWAQWPMPNSPGDVSSGAPNPQGYTDRGDGTVTDNVTGLLWQQAVPATLYTWADALSYCSALTLAGRTDWRLPTYVELVSIVDYSQSGPAIDGAHFPNTPASNFWSSSPLGALADRARFVSFADGSSDSYTGYDVSLTYNVRCRIAPPASPNSSRYAIANGVVYDTKTKLTWQQSSPTTAGPWKTATSYCPTLTLNGARWRLPTVKELTTIVDVAQAGVSIDATAFPGAPPHYYWSSTPLFGDPNNAWLVNFAGGPAYAFGAVATEYDMRCVH